MNKVFDGVQIKGIVKPGQTYILTSGGPLPDVDMLYTIRTDEEALGAVDLLMILICKHDVELRKYIGIEKLAPRGNHDEETYEIKLLCYDNRAGRLYIERLILERLHTFEEEAAWMKAHFPTSVPCKKHQNNLKKETLGD